MTSWWLTADGVRLVPMTGHPANEVDKAADITYQSLMARYKRLKHAKRKIVRGADLHANPDDCAIVSGSRSAAAAGSSSASVRLAPVVHECLDQHDGPTHVLLTSRAALSPSMERGNGAVVASSSSRQQTPLRPVTLQGGDAALRDEPMPTVATADVLAQSRSPHAKSSKARGKGRKSHATSGGNHLAARTAYGGGEHGPDVRSHTAMTVSMKSSHPSPRVLGAWDEEDFT